MRITIPLALILATCDADPSTTFREQGKPWEQVIEAPLTLEEFLGIAAACKVDGLTVSISGYEPDVSMSDERVLGLGFSVMGTAKDEDCMRGVMAKYGAVDL